MVRCYSSIANFSGFIDEENVLRLWGDEVIKRPNLDVDRKMPNVYDKEVKMMVMGRKYYHIVYEDGSLVTWMDNQIMKTPAMKIEITQITANYNSSYFLSNQGRVYSFEISSKNFQEIKSLPKGIINISSGNDFVAMLTIKFELYAYGNLYEITNKDLCYQLHKFKQIKEKVVTMSCSYNSIFFTTITGRAGNISTFYKSICKNLWNNQSNIYELKTDDGDKFVNVAGAGNFGFVCSEKGDLFFVGNCHYGQSGNGLNFGATKSYYMTKVLLPGKVIALQTGFAHAIARVNIKEENRDAFFSWGFGNNYSLGHGSQQNEPIPKEIKTLKNETFKRFAGCESNYLFNWSPTLHKQFPDHFKKSISNILLSLKSSNLKIPKFVLFEILKNMDIFWFSESKDQDDNVNNRRRNLRNKICNIF